MTLDHVLDSSCTEHRHQRRLDVAPRLHLTITTHNTQGQSVMEAKLPTTEELKGESAYPPPCAVLLCSAPHGRLLAARRSQLTLSCLRSAHAHPAKRDARTEKIRENWIRTMEARLVRDELSKCQKAEGVNHYQVCHYLAERYLGLLKDAKVSDRTCWAGQGTDAMKGH